MERLRQAKVIDLREVERGKYFRLVAEVIADGENMSDWMLESGFGSPLRRRETRAHLLCREGGGSDVTTAASCMVAREEGYAEISRRIVRPFQPLNFL